MELMKLTDRVIITIHSDNNQDGSAYEYVAEQLRTIADDIADCRTGNNYYPDEQTEVAYDYECPMYGGFGMGVVSRQTMQDIKNLLKDYDEKDELSLDDTIAFCEDAINLLSKIIKENEQ